MLAGSLRTLQAHHSACLPLLQVPVFVWAPEEEGQFQPGRCSRWWLMQSLRAFEKDLAALGSKLTYLRAAESRTALIDYIRDVGAQVQLHLPMIDYLVRCLWSHDSCSVFAVKPVSQTCYGSHARSNDEGLCTCVISSTIAFLSDPVSSGCRMVAGAVLQPPVRSELAGPRQRGQGRDGGDGRRVPVVQQRPAV